MITVGHTKGGVGKSTIAANLAVCFALDKKRCYLLMPMFKDKNNILTFYLL
ncbi:MAG: AAA family ATPase [Smithella sp.]